MSKKVIIISLIGALFGSGVALAQQGQADEPLLTVRQIMNGIITPTTTTIWGAYQLQSDAEWQEVANAALAVIGAGDLLRAGGAGAGETEMASQQNWQTYNQQMIAAARQVLTAVENRDEDALSAAGNDALYPPCESCHQEYQAR